MPVPLQSCSMKTNAKWPHDSQPNICRNMLLPCVSPPAETNHATLVGHGTWNGLITLNEGGCDGLIIRTAETMVRWGLPSLSKDGSQVKSWGDPQEKVPQGARCSCSPGVLLEKLVKASGIPRIQARSCWSRLACCRSGDFTGMVFPAHHFSSHSLCWPVHIPTIHTERREQSSSSTTPKAS